MTELGYKTITSCRVCDKNPLQQILDLGEQPWCNDFVSKENVGTEKRYPLEVCLCPACSTLQLRQTVLKETMFDDHLYASGITNTMRSHFQSVTDEVVSLSGSTTRRPFVVDIGSNDGTLLSTFPDSWKRLGVESCQRVAEIALNHGINTRVDFFNSSVAADIRKECGPATIISAANVFYHLEDLHDVTEGIRLLSKPDGIFVIQGSYLPSILDKNAFDIMYHEHLLLYRAETLEKLLNLHGLRLFDFKLFPQIHGGSFVAYASHKDNKYVQSSDSLKETIAFEQRSGFQTTKPYIDFAQRVLELRKQIIETIDRLKKGGKTIYALGAPAKGTVLLNYCGLTDREIELATERNPLKFGLYIPGVGIKIVDEEIITQHPDYYLLLAWNFAPEIIARNPGKHFIIPLPTVSY